MDAAEFVEDFSAVLRSARTDAKWTLRDLSSRLELWTGVKIDASGLSRIESAERMPRLDESIALSRVLRFEIPGVYRADPNHHEDAYVRLVRRVERATAYLNGQED